MKNFCNKFTLNVLISWGVDLDGFDEVGCGVGHLFGGLDKLSPGHRVGGFGGSQAAGVTESWGVFGYNGCCRQDLTNRFNTTEKQSCIKWGVMMRCAGQIIYDIGIDLKVFKLNEPFNLWHKRSIPGNGSVKYSSPGLDPLTCDGLLAGSTRFWQAICIAWWARANWMGSTSPSWPDWLLGSDTPTR